MRSVRELVAWLVPSNLAKAEEPGKPAPALRPREILRLFWPDARPFQVWMGLGVVLVVTAPLLDAATIWLFKLLIDDVLVVRKFAAFGPIALAYLAITVVAAAVEFADGYIAAWIGENFLHRMRTRVFPIYRRCR